MELKDQIVSLELAKKLKELKVKEESIFFWVNSKEREALGDSPIVFASWDLGRHNTCCKEKEILSRIAPAFTVSELGEMLPPHIEDDELQCRKKKYAVIVQYFRKPECTIPICVEKTEADARAKMLVYLIENNLIKL